MRDQPFVKLFTQYTPEKHCLTHPCTELHSKQYPSRSRVSSGSIVSDYGLDDRAIGVRSRQGQRIFPLTSVSRPALGPTQPPVQWVPGVLSPGVKPRPGRDADHSPLSSAEVVNEYELYFLSPQAPPWRVAGLLYLTVS
jgi:hypothetical protein